jgi:hypothetical protein
MKLMPSQRVAASEVLSCSVPGLDYPAWLVGTTYAVGAMVTEGRYVYRSILASNTGHAPTTNSKSTNIDWLADGFVVAAPASQWWEVVSMLNKWQMFDGYVTTETVSSAGSIVVTLQKPGVQSLYFLNVTASSILVELLDSSSAVLFSELVDMYDGGGMVADWWEYFFLPISPPRRNKKINMGIVAGTTDTIRITVSDAVSAKVGVIACGYEAMVGTVMWGVTFGIKAYDVMTEDASSGETYLAQGNYARTVKAMARVPSVEVDTIDKILSDNRSSQCVFDFNENGLQLEALQMMGFYRSYEFSIPGLSDERCVIDIQGLI